MRKGLCFYRCINQPHKNTIMSVTMASNADVNTKHHPPNIMKITLTANAPSGYNGEIIGTITTERNYFSVTGEISTATQRARNDSQVCGCIHGDLLKKFPKIAPLIALHLSTLDGVPLHAEANGWYWLAKAIGIAEKWGPDQLPEECERFFSDHIRDTYPQAIMERVKTAKNPRKEWAAAMEEMKPRWKAEAEAGLALIASL